MAVMVGTDFFTVEVLTLKGLKTFYVLLFIHLESRRICLAGVTCDPDQIHNSLFLLGRTERGVSESRDL